MSSNRYNFFDPDFNVRIHPATFAICWSLFTVAVVLMFYKIKLIRSRNLVRGIEDDTIMDNKSDGNYVKNNP